MIKLKKRSCRSLSVRDMIDDDINAFRQQILQVIIINCIEWDQISFNLIQFDRGIIRNFWHFFQLLWSARGCVLGIEIP